MNLETDGAVYFETAAPSGKQVMNDLGMLNTCQFLIQTKMTICKSLMVEAKQVKHRKSALGARCASLAERLAAPRSAPMLLVVETLAGLLRSHSTDAVH